MAPSVADVYSTPCRNDGSVMDCYIFLEPSSDLGSVETVAACYSLYIVRADITYMIFVRQY